MFYWVVLISTWFEHRSKGIATRPDGLLPKGVPGYRAQIDLELFPPLFVASRGDRRQHVHGELSKRHRSSICHLATSSTSPSPHCLIRDIREAHQTPSSRPSMVDDNQGASSAYTSQFARTPDGLPPFRDPDDETTGSELDPDPFRSNNEPVFEDTERERQRVLREVQNESL